MAAVPGVVPQKRQLLPEETHQRRSQQLRRRAPTIRYDYVRPQRKYREQDNIPLDEEQVVNLNDVTRDGRRVRCDTLWWSILQA